MGAGAGLLSREEAAECHQQNQVTERAEEAGQVEDAPRGQLAARGRRRRGLAHSGT